MKKREADFGSTFRHWLRANPLLNAAFELKQTTGNSIPFSVVKDHQVAALQAADSDVGILYKAPDDSRGVKPFDFFYLRRALAFIVIKYPKFFVIIDIETFIKERDVISKRKSLTAGRAKEIASFVVPLGKQP